MISPALYGDSAKCAYVDSLSSNKLSNEPPFTPILVIDNVPLSVLVEGVVVGLTKISLTPNQVLLLSSVAIIRIPLTPLRLRSVNSTLFGKSYSVSLTSVQFLPSVVYCTFAFKNVSLGLEFAPILKITWFTSIALEYLTPT